MTGFSTSHIRFRSTPGVAGDGNLGEPPPFIPPVDTDVGGIDPGGEGGDGGGGGGTIVSGYQPFSASSAINQQIPIGVAIHADSAAMISTATTWLYPGPYQEWLGPRDRCYYKRTDLSLLSTYSISVNYVDGFGYSCGGSFPVAPIPSAWAGMLDNSAVSFDRITWLADDTNGNVWEGYRVTPPGTATQDITCSSAGWNAVRMDFLSGEEVSGLGYNHGFSASGSGILVGPGLLIPDDFADLTVGSVIPHALRINYNCGSNGSGSHPAWVYPATGGDGLMPGGIPMGARIQLDPSIDVAAVSSVASKPEPWKSGLIKILKTLQIYGAIPVDSSGGPGGGGLEAAVEASVSPFLFPWHGIGDYSRGVPYDLMDNFRVVDWNVWTGA